ncbi:hypothetical protein H4R34_003315 [Dimargaris verticillata]|uniref:GPI transamidase subunit PIG-U n=1 Tax=Dimargaris verticillata TaxID=2761393 RepID=A0A9W8B747_9FUNG|nr:hypothetical protein H4R34_003315 [Dimargaris verticillata]
MGAPSKPHTQFGRLAAAAVVIRALLYFGAQSLVNHLQHRIELATPLTSYPRLQEGVFLYQSGFDPYDGNVYFQPALYLPLFQLLAQLPAAWTFAFYAVMDIAIAWQLWQIVAALQASRSSAPNTPAPITAPKTAAATKHTKACKPSDASQNKTCRLPATTAEFDGSVALCPATVAALYLGNPLTILTCLAHSTLVFNTFAIVSCLRHSLQQRWTLAMAWLAVAAYLSFYPAMLIGPALLILGNARATTMSFVGRCLGVLIGTSLGLGLASYALVGSWSFIASTYGVALTVSDLTPNLGLFWYFFIEMFDHFRSFFLVVFQLHTFIFAAPVCIRFNNHPVLAFTVLCGIMALFKSYPSVGDMVLVLALLPLHHQVFKYMRYTFLTVGLMVYALVLAPLFWHLWIYQGSGNANFFYAATLVYAAAQIFLLIDLTQSMLRREHDRLYPTVRTLLVAQE